MNIALFSDVHGRLRIMLHMLQCWQMEHYLGHAASRIISKVLEMCRPPLHLFGHAHPVNGQHEFCATPIPTHSWIFEDVCFGKQCNGNLERAMGLLTWESPGKHKVEIVEDAWLSQMRHRSWEHVWPS